MCGVAQGGHTGDHMGLLTGVTSPRSSGTAWLQLYLYMLHPVVMVCNSRFLK